MRQDIAITGAIDQRGRTQAFGGVNERIEGFFDACAALGSSGEGGVNLPASNAGDRMLRRGVVAAAPAAGRFHVWPVATAQEALEVLTGHPIGTLGVDGECPEGSLLALARQRAFELRGRTHAHPRRSSRSWPSARRRTARGRTPPQNAPRGRRRVGRAPTSPSARDRSEHHSETRSKSK